MGLALAPTSDVVLLDDLKLHLQKTAGGATADDGELQAFLDTAQEAAGVVLGMTLGEHQYTETLTVDCNTEKLVLSHYPVTSVTSASVLATLDGTPTEYVTADLTASSSGIVRINAGTYWRGDVTVSYTAGETDIRARWRTAILLIAAHLWKTQRGSGGRPNVGANPDFDDVSLVPGLGYAIPNAALGLLTHDNNGPVIA